VQHSNTHHYQIFHKLLVDMVTVASTLEAPCVDTLKAAPSQATKGTVGDHLADAVTSLRENIMFGRVGSLHASGNTLASYVHQKSSIENLPAGVSVGRIGCLVAMKGASEDVAELGNKVAMHIAAAHPKYLSSADVPQPALDAEKAVLIEQAAGSGKPAAMIEKMIVGRLGKYYEQHCLLDQKFLVWDGAGAPPKVSKVAESLETEVSAFVRIQVGEVSGKEEPEVTAE
jgi:elongation factor Ts